MPEMPKKLGVTVFVSEIKRVVNYTDFENLSHQEKMRGKRGRLPVQPLGYVMPTKVIFRRAEVFVLAEVCFPRRPHAGQPRSDV